MVPRGRHLTPVEPALSQDDVRTGPLRLGGQPRRLFRQVLHVAVHQEDVRAVALEHATASDPYCGPLPVVPIDDDFRARRARNHRGAIGRTVVDGGDRRDVRRQAADHPRDRLFFVKRGDQPLHAPHHRPLRPPPSSAGRSSTDAATRVMTLTAETSPMERSGG